MPLIDGREGMEGGGEDTSTKEANVWREWFSPASMAIDEGVAVGLTHSVKKWDIVRIQGVIVRTFSTILYGKIWKPVTKTAF